jgi:hypothetical protein
LYFCNAQVHTAVREARAGANTPHATVGGSYQWLGGEGNNFSANKSAFLGLILNNKTNCGTFSRIFRLTAS